MIVVLATLLVSPPLAVTPQVTSQGVPPPLIRSISPPIESHRDFVGQVPDVYEQVAFVDGAVLPSPEVMTVLLDDELLTGVTTTAEPALRCMAEGIKRQPEFGSRAEFDQHRTTLRGSCNADEVQARVADAIGSRVPGASAADRAAWSAWLLSNLLLWAAISH